MERNSGEIRQKALGFLKGHPAGVIATAGVNGQPHASAVYYVADDNFNIYFLTLSNTRKFAALSANPKVAFTVGEVREPQTIQIEGIAAELTHPDEINARMPGLLNVLTTASTFYAPVTRLDPSDTVVIWIEPTWVRFADYTSANRGSENILFEIPVK